MNQHNFRSDSTPCASTSHPAYAICASTPRTTIPMQEAARSKQEALQEQLVQQFCRKRQLLLLSSCVLAWRLEHQQHCKQLQQQYLLNLVLQGWRQSASNARCVCPVRVFRGTCVGIQVRKATA